MGQFIKYVTVGLLSAGLDFLILAVMRKSVFPETIAVNLGLQRVVFAGTYAAKTVAFVTVFWFNFLLNKFWSFQSSGHMARQVALYAALCAFNLGASLGIMYVFLDLARLHYLIANVFCIGVIAAWNFILYKTVIYR